MRILILNFFFLALLMTSCDNNSIDSIDPIGCSPLNFEAKELAEESNQFYMYENAERVIFKDSVDNEYIIEVEFSENEVEYEESIECNGLIEQSIYYSGQTKRVELVFPADSILNVLFILKTDFYRNETEFLESNLIDKLEIWDKRIPQGSPGIIGKNGYATSVRDSDYDISVINQNIDEFSDYEIFGNSYGKAFKALGVPHPFYISPSLGVISIKDLTGKTLMFDRIE